jgi:methyl-accepting chemotaxis protein
MLDVVNSTREAAMIADKISDDIKNQFRMIANINDNTQALASGVEENVHVVEEVGATVAHLHQQAVNLREIVSQFKI